MNIQDRIIIIKQKEQEAEELLNMLKEKDYISLFNQKEKIQSLRNYYESEDWKTDYAYEENNLFPKDLKRGILSQDLLHNLLKDVEEAKHAFQNNYYYHCGVIDAFNEVVKAGVKDLALSHPTTKEELLLLEPFTSSICLKYNTKYSIEENLLISDLFPYSANKGKCVFLFYKEEAVIQKYYALKKEKEEALLNNTYDFIREKIAYEFGKLLSYSDTSILSYIKNNKEKE